tara:strand:- start:120 stop:302 length:183 start_codon:yes stop_codon:yes gene_type:complete
MSLEELINKKWDKDDQSNLSIEERKADAVDLISKPKPRVQPAPLAPFRAALDQAFERKKP